MNTRPTVWKPPVWSCAGKHRHESMAAAKRELSASRKTNKKKLDMKLEAYSCPRCQGFHIGHSPEAKK